MADALSKAEFARVRRTGAASEWPFYVAPAAVPGKLLCWLADPVVDPDLGTRLLLEIKKYGPVLGI
jgi:hypothetical protein